MTVIVAAGLTAHLTACKVEDSLIENKKIYFISRNGRLIVQINFSVVSNVKQKLERIFLKIKYSNLMCRITQKVIDPAISPKYISFRDDITVTVVIIYF